MNDTNNLLKAVKHSKGWEGKEIRERQSALIITLIGSELQTRASLEELPDITSIAQRHMERVMDLVYSYTKNNQVDDMKRLDSYFPSITFFTDAAVKSQCNLDIFNELPLLVTIPCLAENTLQQVRLFLSSTEYINNKIKVIKSSVDYRAQLFL